MALGTGTKCLGMLQARFLEWLFDFMKIRQDDVDPCSPQLGCNPYSNQLDWPIASVILTKNSTNI